MQDTSLFTVSQDSTALSIRYNLRAITLSVPQEFSSLECLAEALSGNCCQKRRARTRFDGSAGWWVIYFEICCRAGNAHVGAKSEWKDTLSHHQFTCSRRSLFSRKEGHAHNLHARCNVDPRFKDTSLRRNDNTARIDYSQLLKRFSLLVTVYSFRKLSQNCHDISLTDTRRSRL